MSNESNRSALPYGMVRLSEVVNCSVGALFALGTQFMLEDLVRSDKIIVSPNLDSLLNEKQSNDMKGWMRVARNVAEEFELLAFKDRIARLEKRLDKGISHRDLAAELRVMREVISDGLNNHLIYRYPNEKASVLLTWKNDWDTVLRRFPSSFQDIQLGVDLWAMSHNTASVFHMMRVLEYGLKALSLDLGVPYSTQNWQNVIDQIEKAIDSQRKSLPKGDKRNERLQFLSEAATELRYFKDAWRNYVSHAKCVYDQHQARSVIEHVRQFMTTLCRHLSEVFEEEPGEQLPQTTDQSHLHQAPERSQ